MRTLASLLVLGLTLPLCAQDKVDFTKQIAPILVQRCVPVHEDDTVESLAARVFEEEKRALPEAIRLHAEAARA